MSVFQEAAAVSAAVSVVVILLLFNFVCKEQQSAREHASNASRGTSEQIIIHTAARQVGLVAPPAQSVYITCNRSKGIRAECGTQVYCNSTLVDSSGARDAEAELCGDSARVFEAIATGSCNATQRNATT